MRLFTKILFASCLLIQTHPLSAAVAESMTPPDAHSTSIEVMEKLKGLLKQNNEEKAIRLINGFEKNNRNSTELAIETSFGSNPLMYVEQKNGKITVLASRNPKEINLDLTDDKTHQAIVENLKSK
ncbi:MAG: hypothetical protein K2Q34_07150, partial [Alphaproteobacteria bacterium]|nr:hypothetical protein [Alphaproteobacteria bacterium]